MPFTYRSTEAGLLSLLRWAGATPWAKFGDALKEGVTRGWLSPEQVGVDDVDRLRLHNSELENALRALLKGEGLVQTSGDTLFCGRCMVESRRRPFPHKEGCPVVAARAVLEKGEG